MKKIKTTKHIELNFRILRTVLSVLVSLLIAFFLISTVSENPMKDFGTLLFGPLSNGTRMISVISKMTPLLFTGVAIALVNSSGQLNIAAEGAFFAGAVAATAVAIVPGIPPLIHIFLCLVAGAIAGALVMGIPGILNSKFNVVTIVSSLMLNYVVLHLGLYIILNPLRDPGAGFEASFLFEPSSILPKLFNLNRIHLGLLIGVLVVILTSILFKRHSFGYAIKTVGSNKKFAILSGINVNKTIILTALLAGSIAGLGGTVETLGNYSRFVFTGFTNHGWDGVMIAVLARNNTKAIPISAFFLAYLKTAADALNFTSSIPPEIISVIQAIIIIFIASDQLLSGWEHRKIVRNSQERMSLEKGV